MLWRVLGRALKGLADVGNMVYLLLSRDSEIQWNSEGEELLFVIQSCGKHVLNTEFSFCCKRQLTDIRLILSIFKRLFSVVSVLLTRYFLFFQDLQLLCWFCYMQVLKILIIRASHTYIISAKVLFKCRFSCFTNIHS